MLDAVNVGLNDGAGKLFLHHRTRCSTSFQLCDASRDAAERFYVNRIKADLRNILSPGKTFDFVIGNRLKCRIECLSRRQTEEGNTDYALQQSC